MTHQAPPSAVPPGTDPGRQVAQLREALRLVERIAGRPERPGEGDLRLDEAAQISAAYDRALPIVQRRFETAAAETAGWAAAGVEALLAAGGGAPPRAAAARLASQLGDALRRMTELIRP
jgi:hypothetical protein